jgi:hypothetical protein
MRLSPVVCLVFAMSGVALAQTSGVALAQTQVPADSGMVDRYVKACLKEDSAAYCRCEFQSVTQVVHDPKDVAFLVQLEEETAGKPDAETDAILKKLPPDRLQWVSKVQQQIAPLVKACPDYSQHHK